MRKAPIDEKYLQKIIETTQSIEGYAKADKEVVNKVQILRKKYGIKVLAKSGDDPEFKKVIHSGLSR